MCENISGDDDEVCRRLEDSTRTLRRVVVSRGVYFNCESPAERKEKGKLYEVVWLALVGGNQTATVHVCVRQSKGCLTQLCKVTP